MRRAQSGFTLTELAVVMAIVAILLGSAMYTLSAQTDQRNFQESQRRLDDARELLLAFATVHRRLPCPASAASNGDEAPPGGGMCTNYLNGFLPAAAIGFRPVDRFGYAIDPWGNRIRYALARRAIEPTAVAPVPPNCPTAPADHAFATAANLRANGIGCAPENLVVCDATQNTNAAAVPPSCGTWAVAGDARPVTNQRMVVALVYATGKNSVIACGTCLDEAENTDGDGVFVWHDPRPTGGQGGEYDDMMVWIPAGVLYGRLLAAGVLP